MSLSSSYLFFATCYQLKLTFPTVSSSHVAASNASPLLAISQFHSNLWPSDRTNSSNLRSLSGHYLDRQVFDQIFFRIFFTFFGDFFICPLQSQCFPFLSFLQNDALTIFVRQLGSNTHSSPYMMYGLLSISWLCCLILFIYLLVQVDGRVFTALQLSVLIISIINKI